MGTIAITLTEDEREELTTYSRGSRLDHRYVARARMILA
ncbi:MAG: DNA primase catalytic subunit, partial [Rhodothermales bacterium]